jgi:WD40 repeat protein
MFFQPIRTIPMVAGKYLQSHLPSNGYGNFWIGGMDFNPIGGVLAFSTGFEQVLQYDLAQRKILSFSDSTGEGILYAPDGKQLLSIGDSAEFISSDNGRVTNSLIDHFGGIFDLEFQPRGNLLAFGGTDDKVWLRSNQDGSAVDFLKPPRLSSKEQGTNINWNYIKDLDFSLDGQKIIFGDKDESIWLWDLKSGAQLITYAKDSVTQVAISPDNETIGYIYWDGYLEIMDLSTDELLLTWTYPGDVAFHPSGDFLFISNSGRLLKISPDGQADLFASDGGHLKFSPTGSLLAVGGSYITIYQIEDKSMIWEIPIAELPSGDDAEVTVSALDFSPDEQLLAVSTLSKIYVFGVQSGDLLTVIEGRSTSISFSSDGILIASGYYDGVVSVWAVPQTP